MKIVFIFPRFTGPYGAERNLLYLSSELAKLNYKITIYTHRFHSECKKIVSNKVDIIETGFPPIRNHDICTFFDLILMPNLIARIKGECDLIHITNWQSTFGAMLIKKMRPRYNNIPILYYCNEPPRFLYDLKELTFTTTSYLKRGLLRIISPVIELIDKYSMKSIDRIISNSDWTAEEVKEIYGRDSEVVYPGIEIETFKRYSKEEAREKLGFDDNVKLFICVSKLHRRKRIDKALATYKEYSKSFEESKLFIIGDGPEMQNLKNLVMKMKLKNVEFLGQVVEEIPLYDAAADYFICTYKDEPFGVSPLEAKVAGCELLGEIRPYPVLSWKESARKVAEVYKRIIDQKT